MLLIGALPPPCQVINVYYSMKSSEPICKAVVAPHTTDEEIGSE